MYQKAKKEELPSPSVEELWMDRRVTDRTVTEESRFFSLKCYFNQNQDFFSLYTNSKILQVLKAKGIRTYLVWNQLQCNALQTH